MTPPPTPRAHKDVDVLREGSRIKSRRWMKYTEKNKRKRAEKQAKKRGQDTRQTDSGKTTMLRRRIDGPGQATKQGSSPTGRTACSNPRAAMLCHDDEDGDQLRVIQRKHVIERNVELGDERHRSYDSDQRSSNQITSEHRVNISNDNDSEKAHELELDRLMTLHLQRNDTFRTSSNTLETLLVADDSSALLNEDSNTPAMSASLEFLIGMQHEQSELLAKTEELEADIKGICNPVWDMESVDHVKIARLETMLGMTLALYFELLLEEGAFRDLYEKKRGHEEFNLGVAFAQLRQKVGLVIGEYDVKMERLQ